MNTGAVVLLCLSGRHDQYCRQAAFNCLLSTLCVRRREEHFPAPKSAHTGVFILFLILHQALCYVPLVSTPNSQLGMKIVTQIRVKSIIVGLVKGREKKLNIMIHLINFFRHHRKHHIGLHSR